MATQTEATGLPSLLVHAARSAAQADGLQAPVTTSSDDASTAASTLTNIGGNTTATTSNVEDPMALARAAIAAQQQQTIETAPTAGTAAFLASSAAGGPVSSARRGVTSSAPAPAAIATTTVTSGASSKKKGPALRRGKWTVEEEAYANRLIQEFKAGLLPLTDGTTLRTFLSKLLNCDPMRISKKFVGNNCIGKQVFRRRTADINRLTPEQIQQSRAELSELERRFLDRVAQTNRVKSSGVTPSPTGIPGAAAAAAAGIKIKEETESAQPSPPWLQPPLGYTHGAGAAMAAAALSGGSTNSRAAAAGRALLLGGSPGRRSSNPNLASSGSAGLLAMAELQRRNSNQNFMQNPIANRNSATNLLSAAGSGLSGSAMAQIARNASAARLASMTAGGNSMNSLMMQAGLSRDQLNALASGNSLSNMMERQSSFDALMSLDFQSLQSIDNLANLIQSTGGGIPGQIPENGMKNWSADSSSNNNSSANLAEARRLASVGRMESLLQSLSSSNNVNKGESTNASGGGSNSNFGSLLQSMQQGNLNSLGASGQSTGSLFGGGNNGASAASLANLLRADSSTGLTALRMQDGLTQRNTSVDDFLSLVASGDISHHDPLLNVPMNLQQPGGGQNQSQASAAAQLLVQQQLLAQASGNSALANALRAGSLSNLRNAGRITAESSSGSNKRKLDTESAEGQGPNKR